MYEKKKIKLGLVNETDSLLVGSSETTQILQNLDADKANEKGLSPIDMNTRISKNERGLLLRYQEMRNLGLLAFAPTLGQQFKRDSISLDGKGRIEKVDLYRERKKAESQPWKRIFMPQKEEKEGTNG